MNNAQFRAAFPEFSDTARYPDSQLDFWSAFATAQVNICVWKDQATMGVYLYVAHEITLAAQNAKASFVGGSPGQSGGIANSKTVGDASIGYDASTTTEKDAGWWNLTTYGKQFIRLARIFGAGAIQLL